MIPYGDVFTQHVSCFICDFSLRLTSLGVCAHLFTHTHAHTWSDQINKITNATAIYYLYNNPPNALSQVYTPFNCSHILFKLLLARHERSFREWEDKRNSVYIFVYYITSEQIIQAIGECVPICI